MPPPLRTNPANGSSSFCSPSCFRSFIGLLRTGRRPLPFSQTVELMAIIIAGIRSRAEGGRDVALREIYDQLDGSALEHVERETQSHGKNLT